MSTKRKPSIDKHTAAAAVVAKHQYFVIADFSGNENPGLLVGTEVKKASNPQAVESRQWNGLYWTVYVDAPNAECRKVCCDVLHPRRTDKYFLRMQKMFPQVN